MTDFEAALRDQLAANAELAQRRAAAEQEMDRARQAALDDEREQARREQEARHARHAELAELLGRLSAQIKAAAPDTYIVRSGWSETGEEFRAKISTRKTSPARSLLVDLDRDDDQVMVRWNTEVGDTVELWRLLDFTPELLTRLLLQIGDQSLWDRASSPPAFPSA